MAEPAPIIQDKPVYKTAFVPKDLDDYGLDPYEFRLYMRISRRDDPKDGCFESVKKMADGCRMSERKVRYALEVLVTMGLITRRDRRGQTSVFRIAPACDWAHPDALKNVRKHIYATPAQSATPAPHAPTPAPSATLTLAPGATKGTPVEGSPPKERSSERASDSFETVQKIVGPRSAVWLRDKRGFDFDRAVQTWGDRLADVWQKALEHPPRKERDKPIFRFQDACEGELDLSPPAEGTGFPSFSGRGVKKSASDAIAEKHRRDREAWAELGVNYE